MPRKPAKKPVLDIKNVEHAQRISAAFQALVATEGWNYLVQVIDVNLEKLEEQILSKRDPDDQPLSEAQADKLRDRRTDLMEVKNIPSKFIANVRREPDEEVDLDPFHVDIKTLRPPSA